MPYVSPIEPLWTNSLFTHACVQIKIFSWWRFQLCFSSLILSTTQKLTTMMKKLSSIFGILLLATQTNSNSREDVSQVIEPESLKILLLTLTFSWKKTTNWFVLGNYLICIKCLCPFLNVCLSFTKQVDCKVSCYRLTIRLKQEKFSGNN